MRVLLSLIILFGFIYSSPAFQNSVMRVNEHNGNLKYTYQTSTEVAEALLNHIRKAKGSRAGEAYVRYFSTLGGEFSITLMEQEGVLMGYISYQQVERSQDGVRAELIERFGRKWLHVSFLRKGALSFYGRLNLSIYESSETDEKRKPYYYKHFEENGIEIEVRIPNDRVKSAEAHMYLEVSDELVARATSLKKEILGRKSERVNSLARRPEPILNSNPRIQTKPIINDAPIRRPKAIINDVPIRRPKAIINDVPIRRF